MGNLAWKALSGHVISEVGDKAFGYGLLIGNVRFGNGPSVTFLRRTEQQFLAGFYFVFMLSDKKFVESLEKCGQPIFLKNAIFLKFCAWFLFSGQKYFHFGQHAAQVLCTITVNILNKVHFVMGDFPALGTRAERSGQIFLEKVFSACDRIAHMTLSIFGPAKVILKAAMESHCLKSVAIGGAAANISYQRRETCSLVFC